MSLGDCQLKDNEPIDNSINERDFLKAYHQPGAKLNDSDQSVEFMFGQNINYHQIGNAYLEFDTTVRNPAANFDNISELRLFANGFAYCFKEAFSSTTGGSDPERNKYIGQVSTTMRAVISKDGDL